MNPNEIENTLNERGSRYGSFAHNARVSQELKYAVFAAIDNNPKRFSNVQREALTVILQKISRIACGDPNYRDNWVDVIGYSKLSLDEIDVESEKI